MIGFRRVQPGLYERIDTPKRVEIGDRLMAAIRDESPYLADLLTALEASPTRLAPSPQWLRWRKIFG